MNLIDDFLNNTTMYRLVLYYLIGLVAVAVVYSFFGILAFDPLNILFSTVFLLFVGWATNRIFAAVFKTLTNVESIYITALILALIITPAKSLPDLVFLFWVAVWAAASKFIVNFKGKHLFNPAAFAIFLPSLFLGVSASWWVGTSAMMIPVVLGGLLVVRKTQRVNMVTVFLAVAMGTILALNFVHGPDLLALLGKIFMDSPILFFVFVMLTEPLTTPPRQGLQMVYGAIVGFLFAPQLKIAGLYTTPESALLLGNVFSFLVSPKERWLMKFQQRIQLTPDIYDFIFAKDSDFRFRPGEYLEWTLPHANPDNRGNRRIFTIASSPTEANLRFGVKFYNPASSFKATLLDLEPGLAVGGGQLAGDFVLPEDATKKLVFVAGGIGITPFRSMLRYLLDQNQPRSIVVFYANKNTGDLVYKDILDEAVQKLGIKVVYSLNSGSVPANWLGRAGRIDANVIGFEAPDFRERLFYLSGPHSMVDNFVSILGQMGVPKRQIKTDFFSGYA